MNSSAAHVRYFIDEELASAALAHPEKIDLIIEGLNPVGLASAARALKLRTWREVIATTSWDEAKCRDLKERVKSQVLTDPKCRRIFATDCLDAKEISRGLRSRLERAEVILQAEQEKLFETYDRIKAEGKFRLAVSVPLFALVYVVVTVDRPALGPAWALAAAAMTSLLMMDAGRRQLRSAATLLYASLRHGVVTNKVTADDPYLAARRGFLQEPSLTSRYPSSRGPGALRRLLTALRHSLLRRRVTVGQGEATSEQAQPSVDASGLDPTDNAVPAADGAPTSDAPDPPASGRQIGTISVVDLDRTNTATKGPDD